MCGSSWGTCAARAWRRERAPARERARRDGVDSYEGFTTVILAELPHGDGTVRLVNRGHPAPLLLYTDGLSEARDDRGRFYDPEAGLAGRANALRQPATLLARLSAEVRRHSGGGMADDMALMAVRRP